MATILVVDDRPSNTDLLSTLLRYRGHSVLTAANGAEGLTMAAAHAPDLVISDVVMPGMDGFAFLRELRGRPKLAGTPVILMSAALEADKAAALAKKMGAAVYMPKPIEAEKALETVAAVLAEKPVQACQAAESGEQHSLFVDSLARKVEELEKLNSELEAKVAGRTADLEHANRMLREQATRDPLTGLFNRRYLDATLAREILRCARSGAPLALALLDLDHFKKVNDERGHQAGDALLCGVAFTLCAALRGDDIVCRYGGEEFVIVMPGPGRELALTRLHEIRRQLHGVAKFSAGLATYPEDAGDAEALIRAADHAMYRAKEAGRDRIVAWSPGG